MKTSKDQLLRAYSFILGEIREHIHWFENNPDAGDPDMAPALEEVYREIKHLRFNVEHSLPSRYFKLKEDFEFDEVTDEGTFQRVMKAKTGGLVLDEDDDQILLEITWSPTGEYVGGAWYFPKDILEEVEE